MVAIDGASRPLTRNPTLIPVTSDGILSTANVSGRVRLDSRDHRSGRLIVFIDSVLLLSPVSAPSPEPYGMVAES